MIIKHLYTDAQKLKWWGEGEWVKEPDEMLFTHKGIDCKIVRIVSKKHCGEEYAFGGHLCGYIALTRDHPWWGKKYEYIDVDVHGGLTYGKCSDKHWIGFDCAPFDIDYRNIAFVEEECRKLADQVIAANGKEEKHGMD